MGESFTALAGGHCDQAGGDGVTQCSHLADSIEDQLSEQWKCIFRSVRASCGKAGQ